MAPPGKASRKRKSNGVQSQASGPRPMFSLSLSLYLPLSTASSTRYKHEGPQAQMRANPTNNSINTLRLTLLRLSILPRLTLTSDAKQPETADAFLAQGVEFEEAAEKWRVGDAAKSARFYQRALDNYDQGLAAFPSSFDLAYNKARVQYHVTQHPRLLHNLPVPLEDALASHRRALALDPKNVDVLFNTAQVLTSLAESPNHRIDAGEPVQLLDEAVGLFQQCLALQEEQFAEAKAFTDSLEDVAVDEEAGGVAISTDQSSDQSPDQNKSTREESPEEEWATIIEPVTESALTETICALFEALIAVCGLLTPGSDARLRSIEDLGRNLLQDHLKPLEPTSDEQVRAEAALAGAKFKAAVLDAQFRLSLIDLKTYDGYLREAFETIQSTPSFDWQTSYAEALLFFCASAINDPSTATLRWSRFAKALECLTQASRSAQGAAAAAIHVARGDIELSRFWLSVNAPQLPENLKTVQVRSTLVKNAETFYRGAVALAESTSDGDNSETIATAQVKQAVAASLVSESPAPLRNLGPIGITQVQVREVISDMVDENLIPADFLERL